MGADLCMAFVAHRVGVKPSWEKAWEEIDHVTQADIEALGAEAEAEWDWEDINFDALTPADMENAKSRLKDWIKDLIEGLDDRDVSTIQVCGWWIYLTGGMTWGDDPTKSFTHWLKLDNWGSLAVKIYEATGMGWPPAGPDTFIVQEEMLP